MKVLLVCSVVGLATWHVTAMAQSWPQGSDKPLVMLIEQLKPPHAGNERLRAAEALAGYGEFAAVPVTELLHYDDPLTAYYACLALIRLGPYAEAAVPDLMAIVADLNNPLRRNAVFALGRIGPAAAEAAPLLCRILREDNEQLRRVAVATLAAIGVGAVPALVESLRSRDIAVCRSVCTVLQQIGAEAEDAVPALVALVAEPDESLRDDVFFTFAEIGPSTVGDMVQMLQHEDSNVRRRAAMVLSRMGAAAAPAITVLCDATSDPDANVRFWAVKALGETGPSANAALDHLIRASRDEDADVRWQAVVAMREIRGGESAKQAIFVLLNDPHSAVRAKAETALANW